MPRACLPAAVTLTLFSSLAWAAPKTKTPSEAAYFPTAVGAAWVYERTFGDRTDHVVQVVSKVERKDGETVVTFGAPKPDGTPDPAAGEVVAVSDKGLYRVAYGGVKLAHRGCILPSPPKPGAKWEFKFEAPAGTVEGTSIVVGEEEVEVPAGKFKAVRVETEYAGAGGRHAVTSWYAPGVGVVKVAGEQLGTRVLKAFTSPKN